MALTSRVSMEDVRFYERVPFTVPFEVGNLIWQDLGNRYQRNYPKAHA